jgi:Lrp/AsnC family leucine-responsive transcriptional regulator
MLLDETDLKILKILQADARVSNQDLAEQVGISASPCLRRVRKLEQDGVIERYVTLVNPKAVGRGQQAFIEVRLEHQNRVLTERFEAEVQKFPEVLECYLVAGEWDYVLRVAVPDLEELRNFHMNKLGKVPGISNVKSNICMKQAKFSTELPLEL